MFDIIYQNKLDIHSVSKNNQNKLENQCVSKNNQNKLGIFGGLRKNKKYSVAFIKII